MVCMSIVETGDMISLHVFVEYVLLRLCVVVLLLLISCLGWRAPGGTRGTSGRPARTWGP